MSMKVSSGHEVEVLSEEWLRKMEKFQVGFKRGMIRLHPGGWLVPAAYTNYESRIYNFKYRPSDVVLMTMPKSGTTWMQEILWTMLHNPDLDNPKANSSLLFRSPHLCFDMMHNTKYIIDTEDVESVLSQFRAACPGRSVRDGVYLQTAELLPGRRVLKTHLPLALMSPTLLEDAKVVYVARNPRDVAVSMCHHFRLMKFHDYSGTLDAFVRDFMTDNLLYCPYWPHLKMAWEKREHPNMYFVFYEDMKADITAQLRKLNVFLGANLSEKQLDNVAQYTNFASMKARDLAEKENSIVNNDFKRTVGGFVRKGEVGDWKNSFSKELQKEMDEWVATNTAKFGISFQQA